MADEALVDELLRHVVQLEKASLHLIDATNVLVERIDKLLNLFEDAAKSIEKSEFKEPLAQQLETLLEQNKVIARGLILLEKYIREKTPIGFTASLEPKPLPRTL